MSEDKRVVAPDAAVGTIPLELVQKHSGIELFDMMIAGELPPPPISRTLNFRLTEAEKGRAVFRGIPLFEHYNPLGTVHGGWPATILDSALGCAVQTMLPKGVGYTTVEDGQGTMRDWYYAPGEKYLPPEEMVAKLRPASD